MNVRWIALPVTALIVTACSNMQSASLSSIDRVNKTEQFEGAGEREFRFVDKDPEGKEVDNPTIINAIVQSFRGRYNDFSNVEITYRDRVIVNTHFNSYQNNYGQHINLKDSLYRAKFQIDITPGTGIKKLTMKCPSEYEYINSRSLANLNTWQPKTVTSNMNKDCKHVEPTIPRLMFVRNEFNVNFPSEAVFANYIRKLSAAGSLKEEEIKAFNIEKAKHFKLKFGSQESTLALSVYPYRNGSKVIYSFRYNYTIKGDGTTTYDKAVIAGAEKLIRDIAND